MIEPRVDNLTDPHTLELLTPAPAVGASPEPMAENAIAYMRFGHPQDRLDDLRTVQVPLPIAAGVAQGDLWVSALPVRSAVSQGIRHSDNGEILFGWLHLAEEELLDVRQAAYDVHVGIHQLLQARGFPHGLRVWNYLSSINAGTGDRERYREFTVGRYEALAGAPEFKKLLPAATAIGTPEGTGLTIAFFAGKSPGIQVENPRQTSAFEYPRIYGPRSPSFSRATLHYCRGRAWLFVSGTASIVGHATTHPGDAGGQFDETLRNLEALLDHAARRHLPEPKRDSFKARAFKLYVRTPALVQALEPRWRQTLLQQAPTMVLVGDLCRRDLLLEIEAVYELLDFNKQT